MKAHKNKYRRKFMSAMPPVSTPPASFPTELVPMNDSLRSHLHAISGIKLLTEAQKRDEIHRILVSEWGLQKTIRMPGEGSHHDFSIVEGSTADLLHCQSSKQAFQFLEQRKLTFLSF